MRSVSVVVPTNDREDMLREALASIRALEGPDLKLEILVGDNALKAETRAVCMAFGAVYVAAPGRGASVARNTAMRAATGDYIAFLDDDDVWLPGHLRPHLAYLDNHPEYDAAFGQAVYADPELTPYGEAWPEAHPGEGDALMLAMLSGLFPQLGTLVARASVIEKIGYFDPHLLGGQDIDWLMRIARRRGLGYVEVPCVLFRGRPPRSFDALQRRRIGFCRRVFLRHGLRELRLWKSPLGFMRSYHDMLRHFYLYFIDRANWLVAAGKRGQAAMALTSLMVNLPLLAAADFVRDSEFRRALGNVIRGKVRPDSTLANGP